ncbi:MAG: sulfite exporter TauE/SafE family protein [Flavobacteriales bacterium]|nr:sulfite exporter TauE/SafE family protein [Flavobacteriia bacterium]NCP06490.1 sulfite exporter TauE/SafE family protein [Flavobacteriales bacterium]PIV94431.1 MAG: permease [Flavobacteriaceae bacterium CG17_big_fil_post_rev_8_21_14_2_50_33_15]PIY10430.1 MAG: permease [Flavobacteriaceae bacterium CG_4_10_14_3_um_filter_33_47]PJB17612.1 MAG: permease [Flavobacteriaceae bacterium CG_4_9_14_3_um_filter_33_16]
MELLQILGYIGALVVGLVLGLVGGGGSILTVPLLVYVLGYNPVIATAYSLFVVGSSSLVGTIQKMRKGFVDFKVGLAFSFPSFLAVYLSRRYFVPNLPETFFNVGSFTLTKNIGIMMFFAFIMLLASISMIRTKKEEKELLNIKQPYYLTFIQGLIIGTITGLIGAGGGFLYVPALVLWAKLPMKKAVGTSLIIVTINSLIGFSGDMQTIQVDWFFLISFSAFTIMGILIGIYLSKYISGKKLKKGFGWLTLIMALYIIYKEFNT